MIEVFTCRYCDGVEVALEGFCYVERVVEDVVRNGGELRVLVDTQGERGSSES